MSTVAAVPAGAAAQVNDLAVADGAIWAATEGGLVRWTPDGSAQVLANPQGMSFGFSDNGRQSIAMASDGSMWIGAGGVAHVRASGDRIVGLGFYDRDDGLGMGVVSAVLVDSDGSVWAGGAPDPGRPPPLSHFDGSTRDGNAWHTLDVPLDDPSLASLELRIWSMLRGRDGALWLGLAKDGVLRWDGARWTRFVPAQSLPTSSSSRCPEDVRVRRLVQDASGAVWAAGSCQGLLRLDIGAGRAQPVPVSGGLRNIQALMLASGGKLWTAGDGQVAYTTDGQNWTTVGSDSDGLGSDLSAIVEAPDGSTWLGDYGSGVSVFANGAWRHLQR
jgi:ligand-binding sensor domain-containing protein